MADEPKEQPKGKSKGKLPIIIVLVLVLAGGGFFMMKGKGDKPKEPEVALGEKVALGDFLVNLRDGRTYLQTSIVVHLAEGKALGEAKGGEGGEGKADDTEMAPLQSAVIKTLSSKSLEEVSSPEGKIKLQRELAEVLNKEIEAQEAADAKDGEKGSKDKKKDDSEEESKSDGEREHPEWDSDTGPILRIYFTKFASQ